jgi:hypothetical protein
MSQYDYGGLTCVVSGGQTGADQAGLKAARAVGLKTAGYAPQGFMTEDGPALWLGTQFGLTEYASAQYRDRTEMNIIISDGTVIFGKRSQGSNLTEHLCVQEYQKPCLWIPDFRAANKCQLFRLWLVRNEIRTLNVAGNRESRTKGIGEDVERFMMRVFKKCKG